MATALVTEISIEVSITLAREPGQPDRITAFARSHTDVGLPGRTMTVDLSGIEGDIATRVDALLDAAEAYFKGQWDIP